MVWSSFVLAKLKHASFQEQTAHPHLSQYVTRCFPKQLLLYGRDRQHLNKQTDMSASSTSTAPNREWTWQPLWPALGWIYTTRKPSDRLCKNRATVVLMNKWPLQLYASFHDLWCYCSRITEGCANMQDLNQEATNSATSLRSLDMHWWNRRRRHPKVTQDLGMLWFPRTMLSPRLIEFTALAYGFVLRSVAVLPGQCFCAPGFFRPPDARWCCSTSGPTVTISCARDYCQSEKFLFSDPQTTCMFRFKSEPARWFLILFFPSWNPVQILCGTPLDHDLQCAPHQMVVQRLARKAKALTPDRTNLKNFNPSKQDIIVYNTYTCLRTHTVYNINHIM